jgi:hypothetical protein
LIDLNFKTALLESLDWDENQSDSLLNFLQESLKRFSVFPHEILDEIKENYGETAYTLIKQLFVDTYIENGLYVKPRDDYEH